MRAASIVTKTGDAGTTSLMFGRRVPKDHPRVEACGAVDELSAALGLARARTRDAVLASRLEAIQRQLIPLMGELATDTQDLEKYLRAGYRMVTGEMTQELEAMIAEVEGSLPPPEGWLLPGTDEVSAALHLARTVCRRAERRVAVLAREKQLPNPEPTVYLNRLADLLWLLARQVETSPKPQHGGG
ncbi:MAG: cob(I)yrinic acid a,c-diamide adenosyltransferase [Verrucomicrobia bacterium]|nr:MAG: cob(I)yrinic acid a,c-diamide adenosyltransferase [Verrucomicrobiota bacterium]